MNVIFFSKLTGQSGKIQFARSVIELARDENIRPQMRKNRIDDSLAYRFYFPNHRVDFIIHHDHVQFEFVTCLREFEHGAYRSNVSWEFRQKHVIANILASLETFDSYEDRFNLMIDNIEKWGNIDDAK